MFEGKMIKTCSKCGFIGEENLFVKGGNICKKCKNEQQRILYQKDPEKYRNRSREYRKNNSEKVKQDQKIAHIKYKQKYPDKIKKRQLIANEKSKEFRKNNPEKARENDKKYHLKYKKEEKLRAAIYRKNNKEKIKERQRKCDSNRKEKRNLYNKIKKEADIIFRIRKNISSAIASELKFYGFSKKGESSSVKLLHSYEEIIKHIEGKFLLPENLDKNGFEWMNWSNQGAYRVNFWKDDDYSTHKWHIDHNIPQSWLPYFSMDDFNFKICWHKLNLQPLSAKENIIQNNNKNIDNVNKLKDLIEKDIKDNFNLVNPFYGLYLDKDNIIYEVIKTNFALKNNKFFEIVLFKKINNEKILILDYNEFIFNYIKLSSVIKVLSPIS